jgi:hypothetical protein
MSDLQSNLAWLVEWRERGWGTWVCAVLDAFEPVVPLGAQMLWIAQPTLGGWFIERERLAALAEALETPEGLAEVRRILSDHAAPES